MLPPAVATPWLVILGLVWVVALSAVEPGSATASSVPPFSLDIQGTWHVITAASGNTDLAEIDPGKRGSPVTIASDRLTWPDPGDPTKPWLVASCVRSAPPADPVAWGKQWGGARPVANELDSTVSGSLCPVAGAVLAARWHLTDHGVLIALVQVAVQTGIRNGNFSAASKNDVLLILQREPLPAASAPDPAIDGQRVVGTWAVLAELDDANSGRTRPGGRVAFTADRVSKTVVNSKAKPSFSGAWTLKPAIGAHGVIDLVFEQSEGRCPSLYAFFGPDLLVIVWPESGWPRNQPEDQREPPKKFWSDGDRNMWILRRLAPAPSQP
ncbi:hypothetical protein LBMAG53_16710 [Planctomycetota bacterium]|nr:hypothetical protein LBMAG53_16710 [Planctomycetota bacterium]